MIEEKMKKILKVHVIFSHFVKENSWGKSPTIQRKSQNSSSNPKCRYNDFTLEGSKRSNRKKWKCGMNKWL